MAAHDGAGKHHRGADARARAQPDEAVATAERLLAEKSGLAAKRDAYPARLSGGQQQRVAIARALAHAAEDPVVRRADLRARSELRREVLQVMRTLALEGMTMLVVTHEMGFARRVASQVVFMDEGVIVEHGIPAAFFENPATERARRFLESVRRVMTARKGLMAMRNLLRLCVVCALLSLGAAGWPPSRLSRASTRSPRAACSGSASGRCTYSISFRNPDTGQLEGIDIDLSKELAKDMGVKLEYVETSFGTFIADLQANKCDLGMFGVGATMKRAQAVALLRSLSHQRRLCRGAQGRPHQLVGRYRQIGRQCGVSLGSYVEPFLRAILKKAQTGRRGTAATTQAELMAQRVDVMMTDYPALDQDERPVRLVGDGGARRTVIGDALRLRHEPGRPDLAQLRQSVRSNHQA